MTRAWVEKIPHVWVVEVDRGKGMLPHYVFLKRQNARHKANEIRKISEKFGHKVRVTEYRQFERIRSVRKSTAKTHQKAPGAEITVWPSIGTYRPKSVVASLKDAS
jgi:hypothetical protein